MLLLGGGRDHFLKMNWDEFFRMRDNHIRSEGIYFSYMAHQDIQISARQIVKDLENYGFMVDAVLGPGLKYWRKAPSMASQRAYRLLMAKENVQKSSSDNLPAALKGYLPVYHAGSQESFQIHPMMPRYTSETPLMRDRKLKLDEACLLEIYKDNRKKNLAMKPNVAKTTQYISYDQNSIHQIKPASYHQAKLLSYMQQTPVHTKKWHYTSQVKPAGYDYGKAMYMSQQGKALIQGMAKSYEAVKQFSHENGTPNYHQQTKPWENYAHCELTPVQQMPNSKELKENLDLLHEVKEAKMQDSNLNDYAKKFTSVLEDSVKQRTRETDPVKVGVSKKVIDLQVNESAPLHADIALTVSHDTKKKPGTRSKKLEERHGQRVYSKKLTDRLQEADERRSSTLSLIHHKVRHANEAIEKKQREIAARQELEAKERRERFLAKKAQQESKLQAKPAQLKRPRSEPVRPLKNKCSSVVGTKSADLTRPRKKTNHPGATGSNFESKQTRSQVRGHRANLHGVEIKVKETSTKTTKSQNIQPTNKTRTTKDMCYTSINKELNKNPARNAFSTYNGKTTIRDDKTVTGVKNQELSTSTGLIILKKLSPDVQHHMKYQSTKARVTFTPSFKSRPKMGKKKRKSKKSQPIKSPKYNDMHEILSLPGEYELLHAPLSVTLLPSRKFIIHQIGPVSAGAIGCKFWDILKGASGTRLNREKLAAEDILSKKRRRWRNHNQFTLSVRVAGLKSSPNMTTAEGIVRRQLKRTITIHDKQVLKDNLPTLSYSFQQDIIVGREHEQGMEHLRRLAMRVEVDFIAEVDKLLQILRGFEIIRDELFEDFGLKVESLPKNYDPVTELRDRFRIMTTAQTNALLKHWIIDPKVEKKFQTCITPEEVTVMVDTAHEELRQLAEKKGVAAVKDIQAFIERHARTNQGNDDEGDDPVARMEKFNKRFEKIKAEVAKRNPLARHQSWWRRSVTGEEGTLLDFDD